MESFHTIQGEGNYQGYAAYFIRLAGCDVGCIWCDVKASWNQNNFPIVEVSEIVERARTSGASIAVITGGEPTMYNLDILTQQLNEVGIRTHIETSGVYPLTGRWDWVCLSPKKFKVPEDSILSLANELKVVIYHKSDFEWAESYALRVSKSCILFLQPEWSKRNIMMPLIVEYVKKNPKWRISIQVHKYIGVP